MNKPYQKQVFEFVSETFGLTVAYDKKERSHRFLEEALELAQISDCTREEALQLVDYVFSRPPGEINNEVGGVCVTLSALANAHEVDVREAGIAEIKRCFDNQDKIKAKFEAKPKNSPLPASMNGLSTGVVTGNIDPDKPFDLSKMDLKQETFDQFFGPGKVLIITGEVTGLGEQSEPGKIIQLTEADATIEYLVPKVHVLYRVVHDPFRLETISGVFVSRKDAELFYDTGVELEEWEETKLPLIDYDDRDSVPEYYVGHSYLCNHFWIEEVEVQQMPEPDQEAEPEPII